MSTMVEQTCHEIMATVEIHSSVTDAALCAAIQHEYDEGPMPNGGFILKGKRDDGQTRAVQIYFAVILDDYTIEQESGYLSSGLEDAMEALDGTFTIDSVGPEKPFSKIEAY